MIEQRPWGSYEVLLDASDVQGAKHRIRNPFDEPVVFIEVQTGTYFGEDDIIRLTDDYGRV